MPSTYSPDLRIELIANGEQSGTWGSTTNNNLGTLIEDAIAGAATVSVTTANQALTILNGAVDQARNAAIVLTTTTAADFAVYVPPVTKLYVVSNTSAYIATIYCSTVAGNTTAAGVGVAVPAGKSMILRSTGVNIVEQLNHVAGNLSVAGDQAVTGTQAVTGNQTVGGTQAVTGIATFTASPIIPTATLGDNTTKAASTAFVASAVTAADYLNDPNADGILSRTADKTVTPRTITAGTGITVTNGDGVSGNPTIANAGVTTFNGATGATTYTSANVLTAIATTGAGVLGSYAMLGRGSIALNFGDLAAGSDLYPTGFFKGSSDGANNTPSATNNGDAWMASQNSPQAGTWRCMGYVRSTGWSINLFLRVA